MLGGGSPGLLGAGGAAEVLTGILRGEWWRMLEWTPDGASPMSEARKRHCTL